MARFAGRKRRPAVQKAEPVHQNPHQSHRTSHLADFEPNRAVAASVISRTGRLFQARMPVLATM
jgi:hypothetical protein